MSCYHPLLGIDNGEKTENGKRALKIVPLDNFDYEEIRREHPNDVLIPCGHCIGCRLDYSRHWADRMMLELESAGSGVFITLTYDCKHLVDLVGDHINKCFYPECDNGKNCPLSDRCNYKCKISGSLYKPHVQTFMKDLREELRSKYGKFVRFFCTGEYGDIENTHRPHYHLILFGIGLADLPDKKPVGFNELRQAVYSSPLISRHWPHGFVSVGDVSWRSCAYVARYVTKKALDPSSDLYVELCGKNPLFSNMSRRPGIGKPYLDEHPDCLDKFYLYVSGEDGAKKITLPKYFVKSLELSDPERYVKICGERALYAQDSMLSKLNRTDKDFMEYLETEEKEMIKRVKSLRRYV